MKSENSSQVHHHDDQKKVEDTAFARTIEHFNVGRFNEADESCAVILEFAPNHIKSINLRGAIAQKYNRHDLAVEYFKRAIEIDSNRAPLYFNLSTSLIPLGRRKEAIQALNTALTIAPSNHQVAAQLKAVLASPIFDPWAKAKEFLQSGILRHQQGRLDESLHWYRQALAIQPEYDMALFYIGNAFKELGRFDEAVASYQKLLSVNPDFAQAHNNLAVTFQDQGKLSQAITAYTRAISIEPDYAEAHSNLGNALLQQGSLEDAVTSYKQAISINPDFAEAHNNLGGAFKQQGKLNDATASYQRALAINPDYAQAHASLGAVHMDAGKYQLAFKSLRQAVTISPDNGVFWAAFSRCFQQIQIQTYDENLLKQLFIMLDQPTVIPKNVAASIVGALKHHPTWLYVANLIVTDTLEKEIDSALTKLSEISLFVRLITFSTVPDIDVEILLSRIRSAVIQTWKYRGSDSQNLPFYCALAHQCFNNDYVYVETSQDADAVKSLQKDIENSIAEEQPISPSLLAILGCYRPLCNFSWAEKLLEKIWPNEFADVLNTQVSERLEEEIIRSKIHSLTSIDNHISKAVRSQYEASPYPRWRQGGLSSRPVAIRQSLMQSSIDVSEYYPPADPELLIAGCGTGHQVVQTASRFANVRLLAVDLSLSSLAYAIRKTQELNFSNIQYMQSDILELKKLDRMFDVIECRGVLHHMEDPLAGWRVLVDILQPGGVMKVGLYSEIARHHIVEIRAMIAKNGYTDSPDDIRRFRQELIAMAKISNSGIAQISGAIDFFSLSECRDLLFHVQEHRFSLPQIEAVLKSLKLKFLGFELKGSHVKTKFRERYPEKDLFVSLTSWHQFELQNPYTFGNMYEFWVQKMH